MINEETRPYHEIANIFPMMKDDELGNLKADIVKNGLLEPIWLHPNGSIIDGRNRHMACVHLNVKPKFKIYEGDDRDLIKFVISLNLHRRHLNESQRARVAAKIEQYKHGGSRIQDANLHLASREEAANLLNVSPRSVAQAAKIDRQGVDELNTAVQNGQASVSAAAQVAELPPAEQIAVTLQGPRAIVEKSKEIREKKRQKRRKERIEKIAKITKGNRPLSAELGRFPIIYADPPWQYEHSQTDSRKIENQYPTMTLEEIKSLPLNRISTPDAILFLWTTAPKLAEAMEVITAWDFIYRTCMIWDKGKMAEWVTMPVFSMSIY